MTERPVFQTVDPATGEPGRRYEGHTPDEALQIARASRAAFDGWRATSFAERGRLMRAAAQVLRDRQAEFAELMCAEMGKTLADGRAEVEKCAGACDHFAEHAEAFLADEDVSFGDAKAKVAYRPLGAVLAVMPWNFPFWQVFRFAAPTLMAGNAGVLKHASNVPGCALAIEDVFKAAGFPADVFRTVLIPASGVEALIADPAVAAVSLTGSVEAGRKVAAQAGAALKKCVLELGGSDAYLVLDDADIEAAARTAAQARMVNAGQSCIAGKRFIVLASVREAFERALVREMEGYIMGDPRADGTKLGPLVRVADRDGVHDQVQRSVAAGARLLTGGEIPNRPGAWYPATVLAGVKTGMAAYDEEVFGPVAAVIEAADETEAVRIANDSEFGLGSGVLTGDLARGERLATDALEAGMSFVNQNVRSDVRLPFGGIKHSGYGRELARFGIHEFVNIKSVVVAKASSADRTE
ncbi:NAD-dependent succinate-semialdehyde dehydrogenase [Phenylobacterium sp.]|uniref:NAD-dependent succinate-semialdehyde dehydrogenase n=1 Tax=Phenylobacterium sp. TaxID=1871053 RepID=UPI0028123EA2|nr:NAD-dependent succinate-semialdehyde dehydrogenase [Phenylobacterium sp.]